VAQEHRVATRTPRCNENTALQREHRVATRTPRCNAFRLRQVSVKVPVDMSDAAQADAASKQDPMQVASAGHICARTGLTPPSSAPGADPAHICAGTGLTLPTSAPGLGSPRPHPHRDWAHPAHIHTGTGPGAHPVCLPGSAGSRAAAAHRLTRAHQRRVRAPAGSTRPPRPLRRSAQLPAR
jgi:hypothetical protein